MTEAIEQFRAPRLALKHNGLHTPTPKGRTHFMHLLEYLYVYGYVEDAARLGVVLSDLENTLPIRGNIKGAILGHWSNCLHGEYWQTSHVYRPVVARSLYGNQECTIVLDLFI